jgi:molybdopterin-dependent oxidoreductase alpha subunit
MEGIGMAQGEKRQRSWEPSTWAGWSPNGLGETKPNHYLEMVKTLWENRDELGYAWRILSQGVCDGCALGVAGFQDWTIKGPHLCAVRLNLLRLNTMPAMDHRLLSDVRALERQSSKELRLLGRLPYPMLRRRGEPGFTRISWEEAQRLCADRIRQSLHSRGDGSRIAFYLTSRGVTNEVYYAAQKAARFLGTNNIDNAARICHAPSTLALRRTLGVAASTCSYSDWIGTDLLVFIGSDVANNQPVTTKYIYYAKKQGTKVLVVNAYKEPGLQRYWIPSAAESALFGTKLADDFFLVHTGGDIAFFNGVVKRLIEREAVDREFIVTHTEEFAALQESLASQSWEMLERASGASRADMERFADYAAKAQTGVFVWSMGITQHRHGVENVRAIINVALARGFVGRERCGLMPIRGHSGVQGGAEMGAYATAFPGGLPINAETAARFADLWGFAPPPTPGLNAVQMIDAAAAGDLDLLYSVGGNFLETLPQPDHVRRALENTPFRVHQDIVVTKQMLVEPREEVLLLPATTRYEQPGGGTETTTERRILFSPEIPGRRIGEARSEWQTLTEIAARVFPDRAAQILFPDAQAIREEIAKAVPAYAGIETLKKSGDQVQWGGTRLCEGGAFPTPDGRARFSALTPPADIVPDGLFRVSTRRGKQFNSMVHAGRDPLTGAERDSVLMASEDAQRLGLRNGDRITLRNEHGALEGRVMIAPIRPRNLQVHWPEGNVLIPHGPCDESGVPDYNALVEVVRNGSEPPARR